MDDNRDTADSLATLISAFGYEVKAVYDGQDAIEQAPLFLPDMALIDIGMPGLNGYETVSRIRQQRGNMHTVLVAVTGWSGDEDKRRAYESGFDLHVPKPMSVEALKELLMIVDPAGDQASPDRSIIRPAPSFATQELAIEARSDQFKRAAGD